MESGEPVNELNGRARMVGAVHQWASPLRFCVHWIGSGDVYMFLVLKLMHGVAIAAMLRFWNGRAIAAMLRFAAFDSLSTVVAMICGSVCLSCFR